MAITGNINGNFTVTEWTPEVNEIPNQSGFIKNYNYFNIQGTSQHSVVFDRNTAEVTLLPQVNRGARQGTVGKDRKVENFSIPLAFFKHSEYVVQEDVQGLRMPGTPDNPETLANVIATKLEDGRRNIDETHEYMMLQAIKGQSVTPDGAVLADMFDLFGLTQEVIDFELNTATTNVDAKIAQVKRYVSKNLNSGGTIQGIDIFCSTEFFDALIAHPKVREVYLNSVSNVRYQEDISNYMQWGVSDVFTYRGVRFLTYPHDFTLPDGTVERAIAEGDAHVVPRTSTSLFRGYVGPSDKLSGANQIGVPVFAYEYRDWKDEYHEIQFETAPLFFATKPKVLVKLVVGA